MPMWRRLLKIRQGIASLLLLWRNIFFGPKKAENTLSDDFSVRNNNRRKYAITAIIIALVVITFVAYPVHAADTVKNLVNWIIAIFTKVLVYIMELLGYILIQLVDFLIQIVQFNNFVGAAPVRIGWPILRDTVNMFFIIVVLVSAFATIIGYPKEFHYRQILPKLLLMAILINFSKTLIGLMIDFSQVVVLTFVNGFKAAAGGNFINALHIRESMNINSNTGPIITQDPNGTLHVDAGSAANDGVTIYQIFNMMLAAIFGIWLLSISITLIIIMVVFFLARIIILWFLLITSPVMFFAWALPGKLQKAFSAFTDQWWNRLSSALIGGPVMAFFLWLSLAMAQGGNGPDALVGSGQSAIYNDAKKSSEVQNVETGLGASERLGRIVVTEIGDPKTFSNFIIMVAFMLLGVQVAVQSSQALAPKLGGLASAVSSTGGMMGVGVAGTMLAGKLAEKGARAAGGQIEKRYGVKAGLARTALNVAQKSPIPITTLGMRAGLAKAATAPQRESVKRAAEMKAAFGMLSPDMQMREYENLSSGKISKYFGVKADKMAAVQNMATLAGSVPYMKSQQKLEQDAVVRERHGKNAKYDSLNSDQKLAVDTEARQRVDQKVGQKLEEGMQFAIANNMTDLQDQIKKAREKNPALFANIGERSGVAGKMSSDPEAERALQDDAFMDMAFTLNYLRGKGFMDNDANLTVDPVYDEDFKKIMKGRQGQLISSTLDYVGTEEGKRRAKVQLDGKATDEDKRKANVTVNASKDGKNYSVILQPANNKAKPQVLTYNMGGVATGRQQILDGVSSTNARALEQELTRGGRNMEQVGMRLGNDARAQELTNNMAKINSGSAADKADARAIIMQKGLMTASGLFGMDNDGNFSGTGQADYQDTVSNAYSNIKFGTNTEANVRVIASTLGGAKGQALATHGAALRSNGYEALRTAIQQSSGEQKRALQDGLRNIMNQAAVAMREQSSGVTLTPDQQEHVKTAEWLKGSEARTDAEHKAVRQFQSLMRGNAHDFS